MATWGAHIKIADILLNRGIDLEPRGFVVGNLGPDCNKENADWTAYEPPKEVTHWYENNALSAEKFYQAHLQDKAYEDKTQYAFLVGYYVHLLSDIYWWGYAKSTKLGQAFFITMQKDQNMKLELNRDYFQHDHVYIQNNPSSLYHKALKNIQNFPVYLDYFNENDFNAKLAYIHTYYEKYKLNQDRKFCYINSEDIENIFDYTIENVIKTLEAKQLMTTYI